jgi:hypothetical protein
MLASSEFIQCFGNFMRSKLLRVVFHQTFISGCSRGGRELGSSTLWEEVQDFLLKLNKHNQCFGVNVFWPF